MTAWIPLVLDALRKGRATPLAEVDQKGAELLKRYPEPREQGRIYYQLTHIHAQSGVIHPDKVIEYSRKALAYPIEPSQKMRLVVYCGDAIQVARKKEPLPAMRREAVAVYLEGLKELRQYDLPDKAPDLPPLPAFEVNPADPYLAEMKEKYEQAVAARSRAAFLREMVKYREVLTRQTVSLYSRKPFATQELEETARKTLQDQSEVDRITAAVDQEIRKASVDKGIRKADGERFKKQPMRVDSWRGNRYLLTTIGFLALGSIAAIIIVRKRRLAGVPHRESPAKAMR